MNRKHIILAIAFVASALTSFAQDAENRARTGIRGGLNASNMYIDEVTDRNPRYGFHASLFTQLPLVKNKLYLQPEIGYSNKGTTAKYNVLNTFQGENTFSLDYVEVPVLLTYKIGNFVDLHAGGYGGYLLNANTKSKSDVGSSQIELGKGNFNEVDYGLSAGLSIYFGKLMIGTRYNYGLRPVATSDAAKVFMGNAKNSVGQISVGFTF